MSTQKHVWSIGTAELVMIIVAGSNGTSNSTVTLRFFANVLSFTPVTNRRRSGKGNESVLHNQIEGYLSSSPYSTPYHENGTLIGKHVSPKWLGTATYSRRPTGLGAPKPMGIRMSRYHTTVPD
jgi:hypothetical protein